MMPVELTEDEKAFTRAVARNGGYEAEAVADRPGELEMVEAGPGHERRAVGAGDGWEGDETLLRDVELAAEAPVVGLEEVGACVLRWDGDVADLGGFLGLGLLG